VERLAHGPLPEPSDRRASPPVSAGRWLVVCPACGTWNVGEEIDACLQCAARLPGPGEPTNRPVPAWHIGFTRKELHAFTKPLRAALELAEVEAAHLRHAYMGTEHLLLGLLAQRQNRAAEILAAQGVTVAEVRRETLGIIAAGSAEGTAVKGFSQRAREVVRLAITEANERGQDAVGPEQLLLALVQEGKGVAVMVLAQLGIELDALRGQVLQLLPTDASDEQPPMTV
ncbi:MAG: Clp protease N-terminal domain-containing protein, partial [Chloroflexota bacterium]